MSKTFKRALAQTLDVGGVVVEVGAADIEKSCLMTATWPTGGELSQAEVGEQAARCNIKTIIVISLGHSGARCSLPSLGPVSLGRAAMIILPCETKPASRQVQVESGAIKI